MKRTIEYIEEMVCYCEGVERELLHTPGKKDPFVRIRQTIMLLALESNNPREEVAAYFNRTGPDVHYARKSINERLDTDDKFKEKYNYYKEQLKDNETFKVSYLARELARLKTEAMELMNQLNQIAI